MSLLNGLINWGLPEIGLVIEAGYDDIYIYFIV